MIKIVILIMFVPRRELFCDGQVNCGGDEKDEQIEWVVPPIVLLLILESILINLSASITTSNRRLPQCCITATLSLKCISFRYCLTHPRVDMFMTIPIIILIVVFSIVGTSYIPNFSYESHYYGYWFTLLLVMLCCKIHIKKSWTEKCLCYIFLKAEGSRMSNMTK